MQASHVMAATAAALLLSMGAAQASVVYTFGSAPITTRVENVPGGNVVTTNPADLTAFGSSLTFASVLAANSTIQLHSELGGYDFINGPATGGLLAYGSTGFGTFGISSDVSNYLTGSGGSVISLNRYSVLDGTVSTDALGNIVAWDLAYTLYDDQGSGGFQIDTATNTLVQGSLGIVDQLLSISSNPGALVNIGNVVALNNVPYSGSYSFTGADTAFWDVGPSQVRWYAGQPGSFAPVVTAVAEPGILALFGTALLLGVLRSRRRR